MNTCCKSKFRQHILSIIEWSLLIIAVFCILLILLVCVCRLFCGGWNAALSEENIKNMLVFWRDYKELYIIAFSCLTLYVALVHLKKFVDVSTIQCLSTLREKFNTPEKKSIHSYLLPPSDKNVILPELEKMERIDRVMPSDKIRYSNVELFDYLGTIELGIIMLKKGLITLEEFKNQFGYRVENCWKCQPIGCHIFKNMTYYEDFLSVVKMMGLNNSTEPQCPDSANKSSNKK